MPTRDAPWCVPAGPPPSGPPAAGVHPVDEAVHAEAHRPGPGAFERQ